MKKLILVIAIFGILAGCNRGDDQITRPLSKDMIAETVSGELPELSIFHLPSSWTNQDGQQLELSELRGKVTVMVMIYTSCKAACPRLVADMRNIEKQIDEDDLDQVRFVMVSIDPRTDTPERLKQFSKDNLMEEEQWIFLRGTPQATREFAAVLAVNYKRISPMDFSHSNIISVFDEQGVLVHQKEGLGVDNHETIVAIKEEIAD